MGHILSYDIQEINHLCTILILETTKLGLKNLFLLNIISRDSAVSDHYYPPEEKYVCF